MISLERAKQPLNQAETKDKNCQKKGHSSSFNGNSQKGKWVFRATMNQIMNIQKNFRLILQTSLSLKKTLHSRRNENMIRKIRYN